MPNLSFVLQKIFNKIFYRPLLRFQMANVGVNFKIGHCSEVLNPGCFSIGDFFYAGPFSYFGTNKNHPVEIGDYVMFGPGCTIQGGNHDLSYQGYMYLNKAIDHSNTIIKIGNGAWIGSRCTIISGADIGEGSVVAAMSLVNKPIPPFVVAGGVPVKVIKPRFSSVEQIINTLYATNSNLKVEDIIKKHAEFGFYYEGQLYNE